MSGAFATDQGNCSSYKFHIPHSCKRDPVIADLTPDVSYENRSERYCHGDLLSAWAINPLKSFSSLEIKVGSVGQNCLGQATLNLTLMARGPGYT